MILAVFTPYVSAQEDDSDTLTKKEIRKEKRLERKERRASRSWSLKGYPVFFYLPETGFGFGAFTAFSFKASRGRDSLENDSQIQLGGAYTTEGQLLFYLPYKVFWDEDKNYLFGELGYYRYFYYFYGIGNNTPDANEEAYHVNFPRFQLGYTHQVFDNFGLGMAHRFENYDIVKTVEGGLVENAVGGEGALSNGFGPLFVYDSRDHVFYPEKGFYIEGRLMGFHRFIGSDYQFYKGFIDATYYQKLHKKGVLATNFNFRYTGGDVPFNMLSLMGGLKRMRGIYEGRYRENNAIMLQTEYRLELPWRLGLVAFADIGQAYDRTAYLKLNDWRWTVGGGLRFKLDKKRKINFRIDYGVGRNTQGFYLTVGEAF